MQFWNMQVLCGIHPPTQKNIHQLESVQKLALKIRSHCWDIDYHILLDMFTLPTLASRCEYLRILTLFKIITGCFYFPPNILFTISSCYPPANSCQQNKTYMYIVTVSLFPIPVPDPGSRSRLQHCTHVTYDRIRRRV